MAQAPPPPPTILVASSSNQPVYLPNLVHNQKQLYYIKSTTACIAGSTAGLLGLTNWIGFSFFFFTAFVVGLSFTAWNCRFKPGRYFVNTRDPLLSGLAENLFSYVLFWTLFYSLVYIYD